MQTIEVRRRRLLHDIAFSMAGVLVAIYLVRTGVVSAVVLSVGGFKLLGVFLAGLFFTSVFSTAPSMVVLGELALGTPLPLLALFGGLGAVTGDYILFRFISHRVADDAGYLIALPRKKRLFKILHTKLFRFVVPMIGALIIASPLPDELGIAILGVSKVRNGHFFILSFVANSIGILIVGWIARSLV